MSCPHSQCLADAQGECVCARLQFEEWAGNPPYEMDLRRQGLDQRRNAWPGQYCQYPVQLAWEAWIDGWTAGRKT